MKNEAQCKYFEDYDRKVRCKIDGSIHNDCCSLCPHFKPNLRLRIYWLLHPGERRLLLYGDRYYGTRKRKDIDLTGTGVLMRRAENRKLSNKECCYCDYCVCRKGHKCSWYKKFVKKYHRKRDRMSFTELCERNVAAEYWTGRME